MSTNQVPTGDRRWCPRGDAAVRLDAQAAGPLSLVKPLAMIQGETVVAGHIGVK
jgi:hypothetical protein